MPTRAHDRFFEEQRERNRRYGLEHDEYAEFVHELELADRIADQASLPPGHPLARAAARHRLGRGPRPTSSRTSPRSNASPLASASGITARMVTGRAG